MTAAYRRGVAPRDRVTIDGQAVVMVGDRVMLLSEIATCALDLLDGVDWTSDVDLTAALVRRYGAPEDPSAAVFALVRPLIDEGLVESRPA